MANQSALSLFELIGAPLAALVQAEAHAAASTARFIQDVGFKSAGELSEESEDGDHYGILRMVTFRHQTPGENGKPRVFKIEVPLLSLIPIPALQIKDAELDFFVKILENPKKSQPEEASPSADELKSGTSATGLVPPISRDLKGTIGRPPSDSSRQSSLDMQIKVKIRMEQADVPAGLARLFNLLEQNVRSNEEKQ